MYTHHLILILHLIAATIWVGGHLVLAIGYLPKALKRKDFSYIGISYHRYFDGLRLQRWLQFLVFIRYSY